MPIVTKKQGNTMELKNNSLDGGLNLVIEEHSIDFDGSATTFEVTTALKQIKGFIFTETSAGSVQPIQLQSNLIPDSDGILDFDCIAAPGGGGALAAPIASAGGILLLIGLSK